MLHPFSVGKEYCVGYGSLLARWLCDAHVLGTGPVAHLYLRLGSLAGSAGCATILLFENGLRSLCKQLDGSTMRADTCCSCFQGLPHLLATAERTLFGLCDVVGLLWTHRPPHDDYQEDLCNA